jgi:hypothetical protein
MSYAKHAVIALALALMALPSLAVASKKLEIDEYQWISIGVGTRSSYTKIEIRASLTCSQTA